MVDSRATTARPLDKASDTCGDILTILLSCFKPSCNRKQIKIRTRDCKKKKKGGSFFFIEKPCWLLQEGRYDSGDLRFYKEQTKRKKKKKPFLFKKFAMQGMKKYSNSLSPL